MGLRIVLTGASRGLGRAMVEGFVERRHTVVGCASSAESIAELEKRFPTPHRFDVVDMRSQVQVERWAGDVLSRTGIPDFLINNAAVMGPVGRLWEASVEEFDRVVDVNIKGVFYTIRAFAPAMVARRRGVIVNFSSGWGRSTAPDVAPYCATKFAIEGLSRALSQELADDVSVIALNPGIINTDMLRSAFGKGANAYPSPDEWAVRAVPYILSLGSKDNGRQATVPG